MFRFITRQHFIINFLAAVAFVGLLLFGTLWMLGFITRHGEYERVPSVVGKSYEEAESILEGKGFTVEVQDSLWDESQPPSSVLKQLPFGEEMVKAKRTVYLSINRAQPPMLEIPNLVGLSFRNAELYLRQLGLRLGDTLRRADIAKDAVLEQLYNGSPIKPGTKIFQGSSISFVLGSGIGQDEMDVPELIGMNYADAKAMLDDLGVNIGAVLANGDVSDTMAAFVFKQNPARRQLLSDGTNKINRIRAGQSLDLWLSVEKVQIPGPDSSNAPGY